MWASTAPICTLLNHGSHGPRTDAVGSFAYESSYVFRVERRWTRRDVHTIVRLGICTTHLYGTIKLFDRADDTVDVDLPRRGSACVSCVVDAWRVNRKYETAVNMCATYCCCGVSVLDLYRVIFIACPSLAISLRLCRERPSDILRSFFVQYRLCRRNDMSHKEQPLLATLNVVIVKQAKYIRRVVLSESKSNSKF